MFKPTGQNIDIAWKWNNLKDKINRKSVTCDFCLKTSTGGITKAKRHKLEIRGDVGACRKIPEDVRLQLFNKKKTENEIYMEGVQEERDEEDEVEEIVRHKSGKRPTTSSMEVTLVFAKKKNVNVKGLLDLEFFKRPKETIQLGKNKR
ncbi:hypothetical protein CR513_31497, partial [Mucuna pruriens]